MSLVIPFLKKLYRGFPEKPRDVDFNSWYSNRQKKYLDAIPEPSQDPSEEIFLGQISASDMMHLDSQMKLLFMRNYNKVREEGKRIFRKGRFNSLWSNFFIRWALIFLFFLAVCAGLQSYLTFANIQLTITLDSKTIHHTTTVPSAINKRLFPRSTAQSPAFSMAVSNRPDSVSSASIKTDSIYKAPGIRKRVVSQALMQPVENTGRIVVPTITKTEPVDERINSLLPPQKRSALIVDSSAVVP